MRVIGGKFRSRVLVNFDGNAIRPTGDRAKEALFNILSLRLNGARVLDLFCGSGALGIEAISRGAREVVFNDAAKTSLNVVKQNLQKLGITAKCYHLDYAQCLSMVGGRFDIIFLDPPYLMDVGVSAINQIVEKNLLSPNGVIVYERDRAFTDGGKINEKLAQTDERKYGKTYLTFFAYQKDES